MARALGADPVKTCAAAADHDGVGQSTAQGSRCPSCSAAVRPEAPWCTQCYVRLGATTPAREVTATAQRVTAPAGAAPLERSHAAPAAVASREQRERASGASWPCAGCDSRNDLADEVCDGCGTPFLAAVRADRPSLVLPVVGDVTLLPPARRVAVAVAVLVALLVVPTLLALLVA